MKPPSHGGRPTGHAPRQGRPPSGRTGPSRQDSRQDLKPAPRQDSRQESRPDSGKPQKPARPPAGDRHVPYRPEKPARVENVERPAKSYQPAQARPPRAAAPPPAPKPHTPSGAIWVYGLHPIAAALANPSRRLRRLLLTEEAEATLAGMIKPPFSIQPERTERGRLDHLLGHDAVHQGAALLADPLPQPALAEVLERPGPLLVLDQVTDPRNIGAILRSAAAFGAAAVITQDRNAPEETGALAKAASGALETVPLMRAVNLARTLAALKAANCWVVGLAADSAALRGTDLAERRVVLVLGAEGSGMRRLTRESCDELAGLAMPGGMESLNVSAAATVALYELTRK